MAINNLHARYYYPAGGSNLPIILMLHGWDGGSESITDTTLKRIGDYGAFVCTVGMRGRNSANGARDASAREIYDIYDCLQAILANHGAVVDETRVAVWGYSGGGGNALASLCKFPDAYSIGVDFFGIADYGRDATYGLYQLGGVTQASIAASVGGTPAVAPNNYYARDATAAIANFSGGHLHMYHDSADVIVPPVHSTRIKDALDALSMTNYTLNISATLGHGYPDGNAARQAPEAALVATIISSTAWTIPAAGTVTVIGYIVTKRFTIWLNANGTATPGIDAAATVVYDTASNTYTVTPLTGAIDVTITQGAKTGNATNISTETEIVVS